MNDKEEISDLIHALKKGDKKAFRSLYHRYERKLFAFIFGYTKNEALTKDILQEVFITLWHKRDTLRSENSIKSFLFKVAYNTYIDKLRRKESEANVLDGWRYRRIVDALDEDEEARNLRIEKLRQAIDRLPTRCREIFLLCKYEGFKYSEISEILHISVKTVQAQIVKAYKLIREDIKDDTKFILFINYVRKHVSRTDFSSCKNALTKSIRHMG